MVKLFSIIKSIRKKWNWCKSPESIFICEEKYILVRICNICNSFWKPNFYPAVMFHYLGLSQFEHDDFGLPTGFKSVKMPVRSLTPGTCNARRRAFSGTLPHACDVTKRQSISSPLKEKKYDSTLLERRVWQADRVSSQQGNSFKVSHTPWEQVKVTGGIIQTSRPAGATHRTPEPLYSLISKHVFISISKAEEYTNHCLLSFVNIINININAYVC